MNISGNATRSAPCAAAAARARRTLSALPPTSPTVGLSCASAIFRRSAGRACMASMSRAAAASGNRAHSDDAQPFRQRNEPDEAGDHDRDADGGRAHVLDPPDLGILLRVHMVAELLDRGVH